MDKCSLFSWRVLGPLVLNDRSQYRQLYVRVVESSGVSAGSFCLFEERRRCLTPGSCVTSLWNIMYTVIHYTLQYTTHHTLQYTTQYNTHLRCGCFFSSCSMVRVNKIKYFVHILDTATHPTVNIQYNKLLSIYYSPQHLQLVVLYVWNDLLHNG